MKYIQSLKTTAIKDAKRPKLYMYASFFHISLD